MCGFSYLFSSNPNFQGFRDAFKTSGLESRGGDGTRIEKLSECEIGGHTLFSVTGEKPMLQPFRTENLTLLFNGEIYNYLSLADEYGLEIADSDTVLLCGLIEKIGFERAVSLLDGAFAILCLEHGSENVWLARDRWGQKPLFFSSQQGRLCISSSFRFIEQLEGQKRHPENTAVYLLFGFSPFDTTLNPDINKVEPGSILQVSKEGVAISKKFVEPPATSLDVKEAISASIWQTLPRDHFCLSFSGGVDSSYIFTAAHLKGRQIPVLHLQIEKNKAETENAIRLTEFFNTNLKMVKPKKEFTSLEAIAGLCDHPVSNSGILGTASVACHARESGYRILLTGMGSDEYFGGYARARIINNFRDLRLASSLIEVWKSTRNMPWKITLMICSVYVLIRKPSQRLIYIFLIVRSSESRRHLLRLFWQTFRSLRSYSTRLRAMRGDKVAELLALFERHYVMPEFMCAPLDMVAQSLGVEVRSPFFVNALDAHFESDPMRLYKTEKRDLVEFLESNTPFRQSPKERFNVL